MSKLLLAAALIALAPAAHGPKAWAQERLPPVKPESYDAAQRQAAAEFEAARKRAVFGPFSMLIRSPEVMSAARAMGDELRYKSAIGNTLSEMVILIVAREWAQDYEWSVHAPIALQQGVARPVVDAIAEGRRPDRLSDDEAIAYDFTLELNRTKRVSDATYARALKRWGERGVVDLAAISGYYTFLAMTMNTARTPPADGAPKLPRWPE
jgi:4-carboxymuconolactone decarboxylase